MPGTSQRPARRAALALTLVALAIALGLFAVRFDVFPGDRALSSAVRELGEPWASVARTDTHVHLAIVMTALALAAAVAALRRRPDALAVIAIAGLGRVALNLPRALIDRPRPGGDGVARMPASGPSFPSGHVMSAMLAFGVWFVLAPVLVPARWVLPVRALCVLGVIITAFARVWQGAHWPSDTVAAVMWMAAVLALAVLVAARARSGRSDGDPHP